MQFVLSRIRQSFVVKHAKRILNNRLRDLHCWHLTANNELKTQLRKYELENNFIYSLMGKKRKSMTFLC